MLGLLPPAIFFGSAVGHTSDFWVEHSLVDECLLGMEVFIEGGPHDRVVVDRDPILLKEVVEIGPGSLSGELWNLWGLTSPLPTRSPRTTDFLHSLEKLIDY